MAAYCSSRSVGRRDSRCLVHLFVDLLDRQLDVELDAVEDVFEVSLFIHVKLQKQI